MRILVVDDEEAIAGLVEVCMVSAGFEVIKCYDGQNALDQLQKHTIDLAILDVMLPDMDGFTLCQKIREQYVFPIIMLTAKVEDQDKIHGLSMGADDYMTKPFNPQELVARVKTQLRRFTTYNQASYIERNEFDFAGLYICLDTHTCTLNGKNVNLTPLEFNILWYLCLNKGRVVTSQELFEQVWKEKFLDSNNTVMAHIARLREKLDDRKAKPKYIKTVWGIGYTIHDG